MKLLNHRFMPKLQLRRVAPNTSATSRYILTEKEREILKTFVETGLKLNGFSVLTIRLRRASKRLMEDIELIRATLKLIRNTKIYKISCFSVGLQVIVGIISLFSRKNKRISRSIIGSRVYLLIRILRQDLRGAMLGKAPLYRKIVKS